MPGNDRGGNVCDLTKVDLWRKGCPMAIDCGTVGYKRVDRRNFSESNIKGTVKNTALFISTKKNIGIGICGREHSHGRYQFALSDHEKKNKKNAKTVLESNVFAFRLSGIRDDTA